jgi:anti-sigma factor RsiW
MRTTHPETALISFARGELDEAERGKVAQHLAGCAACRDDAAALTATLAQLGNAIASVPMPSWPAYRAELWRKLAEHEASGMRWWRPRLGWTSIGMASAAAGVIAIVIASRLNPATPLPHVDQLTIENEIRGTDLGLLRNYPVVAQLELLENYDVVEHLDEVAPADHDAAHS